jgi:hypothetical protein
MVAKLTPRGERRWAVAGCFGCLGFALLTVLLTVLGVKTAQAPEAVWSQLHAYMEFEGEPAGYVPIFVLPFFDSRQIAFFRESDRTQILLQEYSGRERERFDEALDPEIVSAVEGLYDVSVETMNLQGRDVDCLRYSGLETDLNEGGAADSFRDWLLSSLGLSPAGVTDVQMPAAVIRIRFSSEADSGGTILMVRSPDLVPMDRDALEELFAPFDLWAHVGSAPVFVPPTD